MAVTLTYGDEEVGSLVKKAKKLADEIKVN